jgi:ubiquitin C-terminal hydrolase
MKHFIESPESFNISKQDLQIVKGVEEILEKLNSQNTLISPSSLINQINSKFSFEHEQQDSYELYHRLLEIFDHGSHGENPFLIELKTEYKCNKCKNVITKIDPSLDISVTPDYTKYSIVSLIENNFKPIEISDYTCSKCTLNNFILQAENNLKYIDNKNPLKFQLEAIREYFKEMSQGNVTDDIETIVRKTVEFCQVSGCEKALDLFKLTQVKANLTKTSKIHKLPKILTVHVQKVFFEEYSVMTNKLKIIFPDTLFLSTTEGEKKYELTSFIEHMGSHSFGHYIAYRKFHDKWVLLNDNAVKLVNKSTAFEVSDPYMLFYRRVEN